MKSLLLLAALITIEPAFSCEWRSDVTPEVLIKFPGLSQKDFVKTEWQGQLVYEGQKISPIYLDLVSEGLSGYWWRTDPNKNWKSVVRFRGEYPVRGRSNNSSSYKRRVLLIELGRSLWYSDKREQINNPAIYSAINDFWHVSNNCRMIF
ncbi:hypothetical protein [Prochlorococcus marinus]|uniref:hypothetical protein n=1 Tax=Prochlorococcus marinus TaxID=1219 RepID=UPI0022B4A844|nr:hypothetical protein [Prochlorococcus marinus]